MIDLRILSNKLIRFDIIETSNKLTNYMPWMYYYMDFENTKIDHRFAQN